MSSSDLETHRKGAPRDMSGRVIFGLDGRSHSAVTFTEAQSTGSGKESIWDTAMEAELLERVKGKARAKAKEIIDQAMVEADAIRNRALEQGFNEGIRQAQEQLELARREMSESLGQALDSVERGAERIWESYREDLAELLRQSVEKALGLMLSDQREIVLRVLLDEAVEALDSRIRLTVRVNPEDEQTMNELLEIAAQRYHSLTQWTVRGDPTVAVGGMIVESDNGMVDNTIESRHAVVKEILDNLSLPALSDLVENGA